MDRQAIDVLHESASPMFVYGADAAVQALNEMAAELARTDIPLLVLGESGTGKDAYARQIHRLSQRHESAFHKFNCASFDAAALRSQIHSGSHDAAVSSGTLYLDNVQELDLSAQRVLLALLPDSEDTERGIGLRVRVISSATSGLEPEVESGRFRRELYFRLNGATLRIPPLRERPEDIAVLAEHFLNKHSNILKKDLPRLNDEALRSLTLYHWPGNIRELENFARKAVLFGDLHVALKELQPAGPTFAKLASAAPGCSLKTAARAASKKAERELILQALERTHWNRKRAARDLQISYKSLLYKIKQIGVSNGKQEN